MAASNPILKGFTNNACTRWLATLLECANIKFFKVNFQNFFLLYLWVIICVKVGKNVSYSEVKCQSSCFSENFSENGSYRAVLSEKFGVLLLQLLVKC